MENFIIIAVIVIIAAIAVRQTVQHFRGRGGCCGGGSYKPKRKKLKNVLYTKTFLVGGMHCEHCSSRVEEAVNDIPGAAGTVNLKKGELVVSYAQDIDDAVIKSRIGRVGYTVSDIR